MKPLTLNVDQTYFNAVYLPFISDETPLQIFFGGASSGKSVFVATRMGLDLLRGYRNYLVVRNTAATLRGSAFAEAMRAIRGLGISSEFHPNESNLELTCTRTGCMAFFRGLDDVEKIKSITPKIGSITDIWEEEATEISEPSHNQLLLRMRGMADVIKRCTQSFNPIDIKHWIRRRYMADFGDDDKIIHDAKRLVLRTTYLDNQFLTPDDIERIEAYRETNPYYYNVYGLGRWGVLGDSILTRWRTEDLSDFDGALKWGLDFGYSNDPAALIGVCRKAGKLYVPVTLYGKGWTNQYLAERIRPLVGRDIVRCDSAEPKSIAELRECGINAYPCRKRRYFSKLNPSKQSSVLFRIQWLQGHEIIVDSKQTDFVHELGSWQWRKDRSGDSMAEPVDKDNHGIDAMCYGLDDEIEPMGFGRIVSAQTIMQNHDENKTADDILLNEAV